MDAQPDRVCMPVSCAAEESCNGEDDDCDRAIDEGVSPPVDGTCLDDGVCAGLEAHCVDGEWTCVGQLDGYEVNERACDGLDNDCDGRVDEGTQLDTDPDHCGRCGHRCELANAASRCASGQCLLEGCLQGHHDLDGVSQNGCEYACNFAGDEQLNGVDDDCDGEPDERPDRAGPDWPGWACRQGQEEQATCGVGACRNREGRRLCDELGQWVTDCSPRPARPEVCDGVDNDCDGRVDESYACGDYVQQNCQFFMGSSNAAVHPGDAVRNWAECPAEDQSDRGLDRCTGTRRDGRFANLYPHGDVNAGDRWGIMFRCDESEMGDAIEAACKIYFGQSTNWQFVDRAPNWGPCPAADSGLEGLFQCISTRGGDLFYSMQLMGDVNQDDSFGLAWICDDTPLGRVLEQQVEVILGWSYDGLGPRDNSNTWGVCPEQTRGVGGGLHCVATEGDGLFVGLQLSDINNHNDVDDDDVFGIALRSRRGR